VNCLPLGKPSAQYKFANSIYLPAFSSAPAALQDACRSCGLPQGCVVQEESNLLTHSHQGGIACLRLREGSLVSQSQEPREDFLEEGVSDLGITEWEGLCGWWWAGEQRRYGEKWGSTE
jgi:hypothetical protein